MTQVVVEMDQLDEVAAKAFPGYLVRKDLVRRYARQYPVPTYVVEFMLGRYCSTFVLVNLREIAQGSVLEHAYQIKLRDPSYRDTFLVAIRTLEGIEDVSLLFQDPAMEV